MTKRGTKPPKDETKEARFQRVVIPRVNRALKAIKLIGNCSGSAYSCSDAQAVQIFNALAEAVNTSQEKFMAKSAEKTEFKFQ